MAMKTKLLWAKTGATCIGSIHYNSNYYDEKTEVLIPYEHDGKMEFIVSSVGSVAKAVLNHLKKKEENP